MAWQEYQEQNKAGTQSHFSLLILALPSSLKIKMTVAPIGCGLLALLLPLLLLLSYWHAAGAVQVQWVAVHCQDHCHDGSSCLGITKTLISFVNNSINLLNSWYTSPVIVLCGQIIIIEIESKVVTYK